MVFSLYLLNSMVHFAFFVRKPTSFLNKTQPPSCKATVSSGSIPYSEGKGNVRELTLYLWDLENSFADSFKNICWVPLCAKHCAEDTVLKETVWDKVPTSLSFGPNRTYRQNRASRSHVSGCRSIRRKPTQARPGDVGDVITQTLKPSERDRQPDSEGEGQPQQRKGICKA